MIDPNDTLAALEAAAAGLEAGEPAAVIAALERLPDSGGSMGRALLLVARGLQAEADGTEDAGRLMEEAFGTSPALPVPALRALVGYFDRSGRRVLAHHAFLMLQTMDPDPDIVVQVRRRVPRSQWADYAPWAMRASLDSGRYLTYALAPFKRTLRDRLGAEATALMLAEVGGPYGRRIAVRRHVVPLIDYARQAGLDYEELIPAGPAPETPVRFLGAASAEPEARRTRALFGCVLEDVIVSARSGVLLRGERALVDVQEDELASSPDDHADDPIVAAAVGDELLLLEPAERDALPRMPEAVWLAGVHSRAFGHWVIEYLPKVWALMEREGFGAIPLLVDARMPPQHFEALRLFAGSNPLILLEGNEAVRVERLWVASALGHLATGPEHTRLGIDDEGFARLLERIAPMLEAIDSSGAPSRLYLGRKPSQHRRLVNAGEVEAHLGAAGFVSHDLGDLPFVEQIRLVRGASCVVGPSGSALLTVIFGRPGLRIGALVPLGLFDVAWIGQATRHLGVDLTAIVGDIVTPHRYPWMSDYRIDPGLLDAYLEGLAGAGESAPRAPEGDGLMVT